MSIIISSNFLLESQLPLDARTVQADLTARDAIPVNRRYDGLFVYLTSTNQTWQLQGGITNSDWVLFGSGSAITFVDSEVVSGTGTSWTLAATPIAGSVQLYANGQRLTPGGVDYTISGATITTITSFASGTLLADYRT